MNLNVMDPSVIAPAVTVIAIVAVGGWRADGSKGLQKRAGTRSARLISRK
jgi:hypothetical protein